MTVEQPNPAVFADFAVRSRDRDALCLGKEGREEGRRGMFASRALLEA